MSTRLSVAIPVAVLLTFPGLAERINQEGRILGPAPVVTNSTLFNTADADAIVAAMQIFPVTNQKPSLLNSVSSVAWNCCTSAAGGR